MVSSKLIDCSFSNNRIVLHETTKCEIVCVVRIVT